MQTCHIWNRFCFYTHNTTLQHSKVYQARLLPCKTNLTLSPEFDGHAGEPGDKASWLVEDWAIKDGPYLLGTRATQRTLPSRPTSTTTVCRFCTSTGKKGLPRLSLNIWERSVEHFIKPLVLSDCCKHTKMYRIKTTTVWTMRTLKIIMIRKGALFGAQIITTDFCGCLV